MHMTNSLSQILRIAQRNPTVADFLFCSLVDSAFHPTHPLPPTSVATSLTIHHSRTVLLNPEQPPRLRFLGQFSENFLSGQPVRTDANGIFVTVASDDTTTFGYALFDDKSTNANARPDPLIPNFVARFAYDTVSENFIIVTCPPNPTGPRLVILRGGFTTPRNSREFYLAAVPAVEYIWPNLPSLALFLVRNIPLQESSTFRSSTEFEAPDLNDPFNDMTDMSIPKLSSDSMLKLLDAAIDPERLASTMPSISSTQRCMSTTSSSTNNESEGLVASRVKLSPALSQLQRTLSGSFSSVSMRFDLLSGKAMFFGQSSMCLHDTDDGVGARLRERFAVTYYMSFVPNTPDPRRLPLVESIRDGQICTCRADEEDSLEVEDEDEEECRKCMNDEEMEMKRDWKYKLDSNSRKGGRPRLMSAEKNIDKLKARELLLAARRERNRASAARSNERRRKRLETLKHDIAEGRQKVLKLQERREQMRAENLRLREMVQELGWHNLF